MGQREYSPEVAGALILPACPRPDVRVTVEQDKERVSVGEGRTYTLTYENVGAIDAKIAISDTGEFKDADAQLTKVPFSAYVKCDLEASTSDCPFQPRRFSSRGDDDFNYWSSVETTLPVGKKLVLKAVLTVDEKACALVEGDISIKNVTTVRSVTRIVDGDTEGYFTLPLLNNSSVSLLGTTYRPACARPSVKVTVEQDKELTSVEEERIYTVTYENDGQVDAEIYVRDEGNFYFHPEKQNSRNVAFSFLVSVILKPQQSNAQLRRSPVGGKGTPEAM